MRDVRNNDCYIGCRVSTPKQEQYGESLEDQERACRLHAKKLNFNVIDLFTEHHTATKEGDSFLDEVVKKIKEQPLKNRGSFFIIKSIDRFCRAGTSEYSKLKSDLEELGVNLIDVSGIIQPKINTLEHLGVSFPWSIVSPSEKNEMMKAHESKEEVSTILSRMIGAEVVLVQNGYKIREANDGFVNQRVYVENKKRVIQVADPLRAHYYVRMF